MHAICVRFDAANCRFHSLVFPPFGFLYSLVMNFIALAIDTWYGKISRQASNEFFFIIPILGLFYAFWAERWAPSNSSASKDSTNRWKTNEGNVAWPWQKTICRIREYNRRKLENKWAMKRRRTSAGVATSTHQHKHQRQTIISIKFYRKAISRRYSGICIFDILFRFPHFSLALFASCQIRFFFFFFFFLCICRVLWHWHSPSGETRWCLTLLMATAAAPQSEAIVVRGQCFGSPLCDVPPSIRPLVNANDDKRPYRRRHAERENRRTRLAPVNAKVNRFIRIHSYLFILLWRTAQRCEHFFYGRIFFLFFFSFFTTFCVCVCVLVACFFSFRFLCFTLGPDVVHARGPKLVAEVASSVCETRI